MANPGSLKFSLSVPSVSSVVVAAFEVIGPRSRLASGVSYFAARSSCRQQCWQDGGRNKRSRGRRGSRGGAEIERQVAPLRQKTADPLRSPTGRLKIFERWPLTPSLKPPTATYRGLLWVTVGYRGATATYRGAAVGSDPEMPSIRRLREFHAFCVVLTRAGRFF